MAETAAPQWVTPSEAAHLLHVSRTRIIQLADAGRLEVQRTPLGRLLSVVSVQAMIEERAAR